MANAMVLPTLTYGGETWAPQIRHRRRIIGYTDEDVKMDKRIFLSVLQLMKAFVAKTF